MKNLKLSVKLIGGFILTALIILGVGITAMVQQDKMHDLQIELAEQDLPAVSHILQIKGELANIAGLMRNLLTPYATAKQREQVHQGLLDGRKIYGAERDDFLLLDFAKAIEPEWREFSNHLVKWVTVNNKAVEISKGLISSDMVNPVTLNNHMNAFEIAHQSLLAKVGKLLSLNQDFAGGTDGTACSLGKWLDNMDTTNHEVVAITKELRPVHLSLHKAVAKIKENASQHNTDQAQDIASNQLFPISEKVFEFVHKMTKISDIANNSFTEMNQLLLIEAAEHQANTFRTMNDMVAKAEQEAEVTVRRGDAIAEHSSIITIIGIVIGVVLALGLGFYLTLSITRPLLKGVELSKSMAEGDMTKTMDVDQKDEIGTLALSLNEMAGNLRTMISEIGNGVNSVDDSSSQLAAISDQMASGAGNTATKSSQVASAAEEMSVTQNTVAAAMEQASVNITMVAAATEEMTATITEIAQNSTRAKVITTEAVEQSKQASEKVDELGRAADEINKVTEAITEISEQTNLLALNATIEAARAGEAGKGFAVVANEIKDLAKQTAQATLEIKTKIQGIQQATGITVKEINSIAKVIADVDLIVATIATAVEEQTATTNEIAENVGQASSGITEVNENIAQASTVAEEIAADIADVSNSANEMNGASSQVKESAGDLSSIAGSLQQMVAKFKV